MVESRAVNRRAVLAVLRVGFSALALVAIVVQLLDLLDRGILNPVNFFSYFTIQSNLIGLAALLAAAATTRESRSAGVDFFRGAATAYLTLTFIVFALLLADTDVDTAIVWVDRVLHRVMPIVLVADLLLEPPARPIPVRRALWWLAYPLVWTGYTLVRGAITGWYPYPFLNPANGGYAVVAAYSVAIFIGTLVIVLAVASAGNAMASRRGSREAMAPAG
jgi:hypothetical protein